MPDSQDENRLRQTRAEWDRAAAHFDDEPDHGLRDPVVRQAWTNLLRQALDGCVSPVIQGLALDIGCGTGSLSVVLGELGYEVTGIDASPEMIRLAQAKAAQAGYAIRFEVMDAAFPTLAPRQYDVILCRHLLWALPEPAQVLRRWVSLLRPGGRLVLIEGFWHTGGGLHADQVMAALPESLKSISLQSLSDRPVLWGGPVTDERYILEVQLPE